MLRKYGIAILLVAIPGLLACGGQDSDKAETETHEEEHEPGLVSLTEEQMKLMNIDIGPLQTRQLEGYFSAPARVEAIPTRIADIGTLISGRIKEIYVAEGERVQKGQVLLEIQGLEIGEIKGEYMRSRAALESAKANFERQQTLLQENIASQRAFIEAQTAYEEAKASFSAADQKLHSIGITDAEAESLIALVTKTNGQTQHGAQMATLKVTSPISGIVGRAAVKVGQLVQPETDIMEVVNSDEVWAVADIYEKNLKGVRTGQRVEVVTEAYPELAFNGTLEFMSPVVDKETRTIKVRTTIKNPDGHLRPEMYATMRIFDESSRESLVVPEAAVQNDGEVDFVFVKVDDEVQAEYAANDDPVSSGHDEHSEKLKFRKVPVETGINQDGWVQIRAGLSGNETIVTKGAFFLKSEMMKESFGEHGH